MNDKVIDNLRFLVDSYEKHSIFTVSNSLNNKHNV